MQRSSVGVHGVGHYTIGGDPGGDFYTWAIWQNLDLPARQMAMQGPSSMSGGGRAQSLDDLVDLDVVGTKVYKIRELMSTVDGPFCYAYEAAY
jgi:tyrosinase